MSEKGQFMTCPQAAKWQQNKLKKIVIKCVEKNLKVMYAVKINLKYKILYVYI